MPGFSNYTKDGCVYQCYANATSDVCGCHVATYPGEFTVYRFENKSTGECILSS